MNTYCITRTTYNTYASIKKPETGEFVSLLKGYDTLPAYGDSTWKNPEELRKLRQDLGVEDQGRCFVSYRYNAQLPREAEEIKAAMEEAGFPDVHMVADVDLVIAHYQQEASAMDHVNTDKGVIVTGIFCETLYATLCRRGFSQTASIPLWHNEDDSFYHIPESFFNTIRSDWGEVSAIMYHGYYGLCDEMRDHLDAYFPEAEIYSSWAEIYPYCKQNLQHALEGMLPRLERRSDIIHAWKRCINTDQGPEDESAQNLIMLLDDHFRKYILPEIKYLSDVGSHVYGVLAAWACNEQVSNDGSGNKHYISKNTLIPEMKQALHTWLPKRNELILQAFRLRRSEDILKDIQSFLHVPSISLTSDEIYLTLPQIFEAVFNADTEKLLSEKLENWWSNRFFMLEEGFFTNRKKQIRKLEDSLKNTRIECRKSTLHALLDDTIHIKQLRAQFIHAILLVLGENLHRDLLGCFSPITVEYARIPRLAESVPDEKALNRACKGGLKADVSWNDETDTFDPVRTSKLSIHAPVSSSDSGPAGDNYTMGLDGGITYWWENID